MTDKDRIKAAIEAMADAAREKDMGALKPHISKDYHDPEGHDYDAVKGIAMFYFMQPQGISVFLRQQKIEVKDDKGYATVRAVISRGRKVEKPSDIIPEEAGGFIFDLTFQKQGGDWLLVSAVWRETSVAEAL